MSRSETILKRFLWDTYYAPLIAMLQQPHLNALDPVISALRSGRIVYRDGVFSGRFNLAISRELSKYATFRGGKWVASTALVPATITGVAVTANSRIETTRSEMVEYLNFLDVNLADTSEPLEFDISADLSREERRVRSSLSSIGVPFAPTTHQYDQLLEQYTNNQNRNIRNWNSQQTRRLREMVYRNAQAGLSLPQLQQSIMAEWSVSANKAKFWSRQETSLLLSKYSEVRYREAGISRYRWSTSLDERVRSDHAHLHGKIFFFDSPPVVDRKTGRRAHPGEDFNCRCVKIPIID